MQQQIYELKKSNAAYLAALEYDRCPEESEAEKFHSNFDTGVSLAVMKEALSENEGRRPDEIATDITDLIKGL